MRKSISSFIFLVLALLSYTNADNNDANGDSANNQDLSGFIIGRWTGHESVTDIHGEYEREYHIEFVDKNRLVIQMKALYGGINDEFTYEFVEKNVLLVENERAKGGEWTIKKERENLLICIWSNDNCILFTRID